MKEENISNMWVIDSKIQLGQKITEEEKKFYNDNYDEMVQEMREDCEHWKFHTSKHGYKLNIIN
jgi:hypothetical protein